MIGDLLAKFSKKYSIEINTETELSKLLDLLSSIETEEINKAILDEIHPDMLIFGNGDIESIDEARDKSIEYNLDGVMIGRGIFKNPYLFDSNYQLIEGKIFKDGVEISIYERLNLLLKHVLLWKQTWLSGDGFEGDTIKVLLKHNAVDQKTLDSRGLRQNKKHFPQLKKYFKIYISGFDGASAMRSQLMETKDIDDCIEEIKNLIDKYES